MKQKFKRYLVIFPLVFTLLLSCVPLLGAHAELLDKSFVDEIDTNYDSILKDPFDFSSLIPSKLDKTFASSIVLDNLTGSSYTYYTNLLDNSPYYYYSIFADRSLDSVLSHEASYCYVYCFFSVFSDNSLIEDTSSYYHYSSCGFASYCYYRFDGSTLSSPSSTRNDSDGNFYYSKDLGIPYRFKSNNSDRFSLEKDYYVIYQETNLPDFEYSDGSGHPDSGKLNVDVRFRPGLSGQVDRMLDNGDGTKSMVSQMRMTVVNNSRFPIQYKMYIMKKHRSTSRGGNLGAQHVNEKYDDDPVFIYYSNEWVYSNSLDNSSDWYNGHIQKQNKSTEWHYVSAGGSVAVLFNYSQIKLVENVEYTCIVEAVRNDYDCSSRMFVYHSTSEAAYPEYKQIWGDDKATVYQSDFSMLHYSDIKYDPNDTSNGVNPYGSYGDSLSYEWGYNAVDEGNGNVDYNSKNLFKDKNSWYNTQYTPNGIVVPGSYSSSGSSSFDNLSGTLSGYFNFVSSVLGYFPGSVVSVFSFGVTAIVIVAFFKWVFK